MEFSTLSSIGRVPQSMGYANPRMAFCGLPVNIST